MLPPRKANHIKKKKKLELFVKIKRLCILSSIIPLRKNEGRINFFFLDFLYGVSYFDVQLLQLIFFSLIKSILKSLKIYIF